VNGGRTTADAFERRLGGAGQRGRKGGGGVSMGASAWWWEEESGGCRGVPRNGVRWGRAPARPTGGGRSTPARQRCARAGDARGRAVAAETGEGRGR
jgi:hypothetical protein